MKMDVTCTTLFFVVFVGFQLSVSAFSFDEETKRHYIYWDSSVTESIRDPTFSLQVEMGHFMDIVCPLANLGITDDPDPPVLFDLYNVTEDGFKKCDPTGGRLIFACSLPDQENKLTIKFQSISPSPFGFRFQECAEYYFLAVRRPSPLKTGRGVTKYQCTEKSERLRIKVGCSHENKKSNEETTTHSTTTQKTKTSFVDRIKADLEKEKKKVVVPEITEIPRKSPKEENKAVHSASKSNKNTNGGENGSYRTAQFSAVSTLFFTVLTLIWNSIQNSSS